jgi:hypothetical protein
MRLQARHLLSRHIANPAGLSEPPGHSCTLVCTAFISALRHPGRQLAASACLLCFPRVSNKTNDVMQQVYDVN